MNKYIDTLKEMGFFEDMPTAEWQAAPLILPKPGSKAGWRMTVDLRPVNGATIKESWPMPHLDSEVFDFAGSRCFASIDFVSGYWQLPLHPDSYTRCGVVTPRGVVISKRVLPGLANACAYFQSSVEPLFAELRSFFKAWIDDFSLHGKEEEELLDALETFLSICQQKRLWLSARMTKLFCKELRRCGRIVSSEGYRLDPTRLSGLQEMEMPKTAEELAQFIYCCRWMSLAIPNFAQRIGPLVDVLEEAYARSGKRTKKSIKKVALHTLSWGTAQEEAFRDIQDSIRSAVTLSYPDPEKVICVFTDASERYWSGVVTQCAESEVKKPSGEQKHEPLAFLGAEFKGAQLNWSTFEKEAYAIFQTFEKLDYMLLGHARVHVFTDHRNLLFVFAPLVLEPALGRHIVSKVQRWALFLSKFNYVIEHIRGDENFCADILTRWTRGYRNEKQLLCSIVLEEAAQLIPAADSIKGPDREVIRSSQQRYTRADGLVFHESERIWKRGSKIWIPEEDLELQLKVMVCSHCGTLGHRGMDSTMSIIQEDFWWSTLAQDVSKLVRGCYHCIITRTGKVVPRPLGHAIHGARPNEVVHMDFLYMGQGQDGKKYVLILRDDLSSYIWLWPTEDTTAASAAEELCVWIGVFGAMVWLVSDQGSHFKNALINSLTQEIRAKHHFTTAYSPWANGSVERICREVLRSSKALLSEWKLGAKDWPSVLEAVQSVINHAPLRRLGLRNKNDQGVYRTPLEVFTGHKPVRPLMRALQMPDYETSRSLDEVHMRMVMGIDELQSALEGMHKEVEGLTSASRKRQVERHNKRTNVHCAKFVEGDFVLVRRAQPGGHKLQFVWRGPRRVVGVKSDWVYVVENLISEKKEVVHARRLHLYRVDMDGKEVSPSLRKTAEHSEMSYQILQELRNIREVDGELQVEVEWEGLPDRDDWTWEPLQQIFEDVPGRLEDFLNTTGARVLKKRALTQCNLE